MRIHPLIAQPHKAKHYAVVGANDPACRGCLILSVNRGEKASCGDSRSGRGSLLDEFPTALGAGLEFFFVHKSAYFAHCLRGVLVTLLFFSFGSIITFDLLEVPFLQSTLNLLFWLCLFVLISQ